MLRRMVKSWNNSIKNAWNCYAAIKNMQLRGIQFVLMPNRWIIIEANLFRRQICGCGEITLFESIILSPPQPQLFWLILTSQLWRITASSLFSFLLFFLFSEIDGAQFKTLRPLQNIYSALIPQSLLMFSGLLLLLLHQSLNPNIWVLDSMFLFFCRRGWFGDDVFVHLQRQTSRLLMQLRLNQTS